MNVYRMSSAGACPRVIAAEILGYEPIPESGGSTRLLEHATRHEAIFADYFTQETGIELEDAGLCQQCLEEFGDERYGHHVEIKTTNFRTIGHMDRRTLPTLNPVEIKSLGRFGYDKFIKEPFTGQYSSYTGQEAMYLHHAHMPGLYLVGNRDTGALKIYSIAYKQEHFPGNFDRIELPITGGDLLDKFDDIEMNYVRHGELPLGIPGNSCRWCRFKFLCEEVKQEEKDAPVVKLPSILEASVMYRDGHALESQGKSMKAEGKDALLAYAKEGMPKYKTDIASVVYRGQTTKKTLNPDAMLSWMQAYGYAEDKLPDGFYTESKPYDDIGIYLLKEKKE